MNTELYKQALAVFGPQHQQDKCWEEFAEYAQALYEHEWECGSYQRVLEELADVLIMLEQMAMWLGLHAPALDTENPPRPLVHALVSLQIEYLHLMQGRANECSTVEALAAAWDAAECKAQEAPLLVAEYKAAKLKRLEWRLNNAIKTK